MSKIIMGELLSIQSFLAARVEEIWKEIKKLIGNKNTMTNIYRMQPYNSLMSGYLFIGFIGFML